MIRPRRRRRPGFTLVELMVVIVIIAILIALLIPVIGGAVRAANNARVTGEIQLFANALSAFKERYNDYPPSRVILSETGSYPATTLTTDVGAYSPPNGWAGFAPTGTPDITIGALSERSQRYLRKFWPRAVLYPTATPAYFPDYNGNAVAAGATADLPLLYLDGAECLVFFLGGIPTINQQANGSAVFGTSGFAKDAKYPFRNAGVTGTTQSTSNRDPAFYEFNAARLVDSDGDGIPGYIDPLGTGTDGRFYAYFAAYNNGEYDPNDVNGVETDDASNAISNGFRVNFGLSTASGGFFNTASPAPNPYTSSPPVPGASSGNPNGTGQAVSYLNPNTYQILSAGGDRGYGAGGSYSANDTTTKLPIDYFLQNAYPATAVSIRAREQDNLSNFTTGRLD